MSRIGNTCSYSRVEQYGSINVSTLLVGTKCDLQRNVPEENVVQMAEEFNIPWIETR